ncbi:MAG: hypothetical protein CM15mP49_02650 [Actinomycetota bacterium]|nr:MAG: hypothetical protein CM15mP49_02650 [Actinomycetota bacterium]
MDKPNLQMEKLTEEKTDKVSELELELVRVRLELNSEKKLREAAERNADDLRFAMRMLTSGENSRPQQVPQSAGSTQINQYLSES